MNPGSKEHIHTHIRIPVCFPKQCGYTKGLLRVLIVGTNRRLTLHQWRLTWENAGKVQQIEHVETGIHCVEHFFLHGGNFVYDARHVRTRGKIKAHKLVVHMDDLDMPTNICEYSYHSKLPLSMWRVHLKGCAHHLSQYILTYGFVQKKRYPRLWPHLFSEPGIFMVLKSCIWYIIMYCLR